MRLSSKPANKSILNLNLLYKQVLNEIFDSVIETKYEVIQEYPYIIFRFKTNLNNSYDLEFHFATTSNETKLSNNKTIGDYYKGDSGFITIVDIGFTPTEVLNKNDFEQYTKNTNRNEQIELMGRLTYLIQDFIKKQNKINIFVLGYDINDTKLKMYNKMILNHFSNNFIIIDGESWQFEKGATYLIKNNY